MVFHIIRPDILLIQVATLRVLYVKPSIKIYLAHAIENTPNQEARNPLHILRYARGSIPRKNPGVPEYFLPFVERLLCI